MADIDFYGGIGDDNGEEGFGLDDDLDGEDNYNTDDKLSPLQKLEKYMQSDNVYTRQMVARGMLDTIRAVEDEEEDCTPVLEAMVKLSEDSDPIVRSELMEQIPHLAMYCQENKDLFPNSVSLYILPMVVRYLNDRNNQVRKTSQAALLVLLEQELISKADIEEQVVSVILDLASPDSMDDYRTEAVALMSKMSQLLGRDMTERLFLSRFCEMCTDPLFHVRKVCAANFGDFCTVVGQDNTERELLPKFYYLCEDGVWGVRKACAECFMAVSCSCSLDVRRGELSNLFVNLLCDLSRWVRMAAFQQLGPFISTFADSELTGLFVNEEGVLIVKNPESLEILRDLEERIREKEEFVEDVRMFEREKQKAQEGLCDSSDNLETMDISDSNNPNDVLVSSDDSLSVEEKRAHNYETSSTENTIKTEQSSDSSISNDSSVAQCDNTTTDQENTCDIKEPVSDSSVCASSSDLSNNNIERTSVDSDSSSQLTCDTSKPEVQDSPQEEDFNSFNYWRAPLPEVDLTLSEEHKADDNQLSVYARGYNTVTLEDVALNDVEKNNVKNLNSDSEVLDEGQQIMTANVCTLNEVSETVDNIGTTHVIGDQLKELSLQNENNVHDDILGYIDSDLLLSLMPLADLSGTSLEFIDAESPEHIDEAALAQQQDIVPQSLLESYLGMADPSRAQTVDTEITRHCAYNLPAVAYTLGRKNWNCIKLLYETLASDMQWKVRRTLAFSIHEMAIILGSEITHHDLVPVFDGFLKDLDEVRIGVLRHFSDFLRLLTQETRKQYLSKMDSFMSLDNHKNWRFRFELAEQLISITELFSATEVSQYVLPLGLALCEDRVSEVRRMAFSLMSVIMRKLSTDDDDKLMEGLLNQLVNLFAKSNKWLGRQIFAQLTQAIIDYNAVPLNRLVTIILPGLFALSTDSVPNVRISVAKALSQSLMNKGFFFTEKNPCCEELKKVIEQLQNDQDRDVRYFSSPVSETTYEEEDLEEQEHEPLSEEDKVKNKYMSV
ncbi:serine/threonine-protein phosphatase 4 regulatory subunit 1-like isoform X2 [Mytilus galloprovincialis]|uniref:serine/threonine-protein phosphatase 4 regulatory subunit 1-like isoform X2 n=1 Tax=Mytilus galloprovincialis TaxID=29158 RepID=UPI003F7B9768